MCFGLYDLYVLFMLGLIICRELNMCTTNVVVCSYRASAYDSGSDILFDPNRFGTVSLGLIWTDIVYRWVERDAITGRRFQKHLV